MARSYEIRVDGVEHTELSLRGKDEALALNLRLANEEVARLLDERLKAHAPANDRRGVFARSIGRTRRFAGQEVANTFGVDVGVRDPSVAAFVEYGTGIYAAPERLGPHRPWTETRLPGRGRGLGPMFDARAGFGEFWRRRVTIQGMRPRPFIHTAVDEVFPAIEALYRDAVDRSV